jgi:tRNA nucleotidyltransferase (CCA-adding enzyme)
MNRIILETLQEVMKEQYFRKMLNKTGCKNPKNMNINELEYFAYDNDLDFLFRVQSEKIINEVNLLNIKINNIMKFNIDVMYILSKLCDISQNSFIVGGSIRDILIDETPKDFDFVTDISYDKLKEIFNSDVFSFKETGKQFLVFNLNYNGVDYEIANFRKDGTYSDSRRPDSVSIGTIDDDMARRDFTINAMYWNHLVGLVCSKQSFEDIKNYKLRFIGNPEDRIKEDGLRVMRFYRILKSKNLTPDEKSLRAVRTNFDKMLQVSSHRIMMEIERICL